MRVAMRSVSDYVRKSIQRAGDDLAARVSCDIRERQITPALPPSIGITAPLT